MNARIKEEIITVRPNTLRSENSLPLNLTEQRILFFSIFKIQTNATSVSFTKMELEERFNVDFGSWRDIKNYLMNLRNFGMDVLNEKTDKIVIINAFSRLEYDNGLFTFKFTEEFLPAIDNQKRFLQFGMGSIEKFKCKYSIYLYDYLKDSMWGQISVKRNLSVKEMKSIFKIDESKYVGRIPNFKKRVWEPAMKEINLYTDYKIEIISKGRGERTVYTINRIENENLAAKKKVIEIETFKCGLGKDFIDMGCSECMKINKCIFDVSTKAIKNAPDSWDMGMKLGLFMEENFWRNKYYSLTKRIDNKVASEMELAFYNYAINQEKLTNKYRDDKKDIDIEEALDNAKSFYFTRLDVMYDVQNDGDE